MLLHVSTTFRVFATKMVQGLQMPFLPPPHPPPSPSHPLSLNYFKYNVQVKKNTSLLKQIKYEYVVSVCMQVRIT